MVIGLLAVTAIPTVIGVGQAVSAQKRQNAASKEQEKINLAAAFADDGEYHEGGQIVLIGGRMLIDTPESSVKGHKFCGYHFKYPSEDQHLGLVSTIADDPPMLNWIFVGKDSHAVHHGSRKETIDHVIGPWGWSEDEAWVTLRGSPDGFVAVAMDSGGGRVWVVFWDPDGQLLEQAGPERCKPLRLRRKPVMGMESKYVRGKEGG